MGMHALLHGLWLIFPLKPVPPYLISIIWVCSDPLVGRSFRFPLLLLLLGFFSFIPSKPVSVQPILNSTLSFTPPALVSVSFPVNSLIWFPQTRSPSITAISIRLQLLEAWFTGVSGSVTFEFGNVRSLWISSSMSFKISQNSGYAFVIHVFQNGDFVRHSPWLPLCRSSPAMLLASSQSLPL